ncbi:unnamed protein product, partial [marine sediment metagenome]
AYPDSASLGSVGDRVKFGAILHNVLIGHRDGLRA